MHINMGSIFIGQGKWGINVGTFILEMLRNIVGKGENTSFHSFALFQKGFQKWYSFGSLKHGFVW